MVLLFLVELLGIITIILIIKMKKWYKNKGRDYEDSSDNEYDLLIRK
jgi:hypothetical protein